MFNKKYITNLLSSKVEESLYLDYKSGITFNLDDEKSKIELSRDISSFANADGGIIVYGIGEENHVPTSYSFVNGRVLTKERLEDIIQSSIFRKIEGIIIHPIRIENNIEKTVYIIKIPKSTNAPHMAKDHCYYRRVNFRRIQMEEYEVREFYSIRNRTDIEVFRINFNDYGGSHSENKFNELTMNLVITLKNIGSLLSKHFKFNFSISSILFKARYHSIHDYNTYINYSENDRTYFSIPGSQLIFPNEEFNIIKFQIYLRFNSLNVFLKENIEYTLYFEGGSKHGVVNLYEIYKREKGELTQAMFFPRNI